MKGWRYDSYRHSLAARGIKTRKSHSRRETITEVILRGIREYGISPRRINIGECDWFAEQVVESVPGSRMMMSDEYEPQLPRTHFWVYYKGKHYDAEAPEGVSDVWDLPFYKRLIKKHDKYKVRYVRLR